MGENEIKRLRLSFDEALKEGIMKVLGTTKGAYECCVCCCIISGELQAMQHSAGAKHLSKCQAHKHKLIANTSYDDISDKESNSSSISISPTHEVTCKKDLRSLQLSSILNEDKSSPLFYCDICMSGFTGPKPYDDHMNGKQHKKKLTQVTILTNHRQGSRSNTPSPTPSSNATPPASGSSVPEFDPCIVESGFGGEKYQCTVCNGLLLNGMNTISQHLAGRNHLKNARYQMNPEQDGPVPKKRCTAEFIRPLPPNSPLRPERFESSVTLNDEPCITQNENSDDDSYVNIEIIHSHDAIPDLF